MPLTKLATDAFGVLTISLVCLTAVLGLLCICLSLHFQFCIRRRRFPQLSYFNRPWITRIILILVTILWGFGEIVRLNVLRTRLFSSQLWQKNICKFYILSNLGFAEPSMLLMLAFLLSAALKKSDSRTMFQHWNRKTVSCVLLCCIPIFCMQFVLILVGPRYNNEKGGKRTKMAKLFTCFSSNSNEIVCTYPLISTVILGAFYALLISYITYIGTRMLSLAINKGLRRRIYILISAVVLFLPLRALLLGFSVFPHPGNLTYEAIVFLSFLMLLICSLTGICMLVYFPVADSLALRDVGHIEIEGMPYDDYYYDGASLIANQSHQVTSMNSDASSKHGSMSFRTITKDGLPSGSTGDARSVQHAPDNSLSFSGLPPFLDRPVAPPGDLVVP